MRRSFDTEETDKRSVVPFGGNASQQRDLSASARLSAPPESADPPCTSIIHDNTEITLRSRQSATAAEFMAQTKAPRASAHKDTEGCTSSPTPQVICGVDTPGYPQLVLFCFFFVWKLPMQGVSESP